MKHLTLPLTEDNQAISECRAYDIKQKEDSALAGFDGAGVLYAVEYQKERCFVMRERVRGPSSQYQVGVGGQYSHDSDPSRFARAKDETDEEFYGLLTLKTKMLVRHAGSQGKHLIHLTGKMGDWAYVTAVAINKDCQAVPTTIAEINRLNGLLFPFGAFFIGNLQFNVDYTVEQAIKDATDLLSTYEQNEQALQQYVPSEITEILNFIKTQTDKQIIDELKFAVMQKFNLMNVGSRPFLYLVDKIDELTSHALGDYTEAKSTGLIKEDDLHALITGEKESADILYFDNGGNVKEQRSIQAEDIFNGDAAVKLLKETRSPAYSAQLATQQTSTWYSPMWGGPQVGAQHQGAIQDVEMGEGQDANSTNSLTI